MMVGEERDHETFNNEAPPEEDENRIPNRWFWASNPIDWFSILSRETHWSFVVGVVVVYGMNQGFGCALYKILFAFLDIEGDLISFLLGVYGLISIPYALVLLVGLVLQESPSQSFSCRQIWQKVVHAKELICNTLKSEDVWKPCLYMYLSFALSLDIHDGLFYWQTDSKVGPSFSKETIGIILAIGSIGSFLGAILYQNKLKTRPLRSILFWTQLCFRILGMLDLVFILSLNLKLKIPDKLFACIDGSVSKMIVDLRWMSFYVLSSLLCPPGIEGTFYGLLMSIDNFGGMTSSWFGSSLLCVLNVTKTQFDNLWLAILIRNVLRITPLCLLCLIPEGSSDSLGFTRVGRGSENVEITQLVSSSDSSTFSPLQDGEIRERGYEEMELTPELTPLVGD